MTRPLCVFPKVAKYKGSGNTNDATNFTCVTDEPDAEREHVSIGSCFVKGSRVARPREQAVAIGPDMNGDTIHSTDYIGFGYELLLNSRHRGCAEVVGNIAHNFGPARI